MVLIKSALIYAFLGCLFTFLMTSIGALSVLFIKGNNITKLKNISYGCASGVMLAAAVIGCAPIRPLADRLRARLYGGEALSVPYKAIQAGLYVLAFAGLCWCLLRLAPSGYNPFIYFRF